MNFRHLLGIAVLGITLRGCAERMMNTIPFGGQKTRKGTLALQTFLTL